MNKIRIATIALTALSLLNYLVGGIMGFVLTRGENLKTFGFVFAVCVFASVVCLVADWGTLRQAESRMEYRVLTLRKWRFVREPRRMKPDDDGLQALQMGITGWAFSLTVLLYALALIWPDRFWMLSSRVLISATVLISVASGVVIGFIRARRQEKKGESL